MRSYKPALAAMLGSALLVAILAAPASAAVVVQGRIVVVNGRPGGSVDVCLNGKEIKSSLRYGQHAARMANAGSRTLKFRKSSSGTCRGELLAQKSFELAAGSDWVVVLTKSAPGKVLAWDATPVTYPVIVRHASDIGPAGFKYVNPEGGTPWYPSADEPYSKGQYGVGNPGGAGTVFWAHQPPAQEPIAGPVNVFPPAGTKSELILIGSSLGNVRLKLITLPNLDT